MKKKKSHCIGFKLKRGNRVWVTIPVNATIESVNKKYGYTLLIDEIGKGVMMEYCNDSDVRKINNEKRKIKK